MKVIKEHLIGVVIILTITAYLGSYLMVEAIYRLTPTQKPVESLYVPTEPLEPTSVLPSKYQLQAATNAQ